MRKSLCSKCRKIVPQGEGCEKSYCNRGKSGFRGKSTDPWYGLSMKEAKRIGFRTNWKGNPNIPLNERRGYRAEQLRRQPYCEECKSNGIMNDVTEKGEGHVDHIVPFRSASTKEEQRRLFIDPDNHRTLCVSHHMSKTGRSS